jgi:dihydrofolate reductase
MPLSIAAFIITSLDGFSERSNGQFDWFVPDREFDEFAVAQLDDADTLVFGRATYEHMAAYWPTEQAQVNDPGITTGMNHKAKIVFSNSLQHADWSNTTLVSGDAIEHVQAMKSVEDRKLLVLGSARLTAQLLTANVLDELRIMICPTVLGRGRSLVDHLEQQLELTLNRLRQFDSGNVLLTYGTR